MARQTPRQYEVNTQAVIGLVPSDGYADASPAPTVQIIGPQGQAVLASTNATRGTASATATILAGSNIATCNAVTNFVPGMSVWVATAGGRGWHDTVVDVDAVAKTLRLAGECRDGMTGGTIKDASLSATLSAASNANILRNCRAVFRYSVGGIPKSITKVVDFVRFPFSIPLDDSEVEEFERSTATHGQIAPRGEYASFMRQAEDDIAMELRGQQILPDLCIERSLLKSAMMYRVLMLRNITRPDIYDKWAALYDAQMAAFLQSHTWYDSDDDLVDSMAPAAGGASTDPDAPWVTPAAPWADSDRMPVKYMKVG